MRPERVHGGKRPSVIEEARGEHDGHVFTYRGAPVARMLNSAWRPARADAGLREVRAHDLEHMFGRRLRVAGVSFEDRQDLLGHRSGRTTTDSSAAEIAALPEAANRACGRPSGETPTLRTLEEERVAEVS